MMKLPENTQVKREGDTLKVEMTVLPNLEYFNGHFSTAPVLAGVVQVGWVLTLLERGFNIKLLFNSMKLVKFTRLILPNTDIVLTLTYMAQKHSAKFVIHAGEDRCASGILMFELDEQS